MGRKGRGLTVRQLCAGLVTFALIACSPQPAAEASPAAKSETAATHPVSGLNIVPVTVTSGSKTHRFRAELAASAEAQQQGLMFRTSMGPDEAMIFPSFPQTARSFWMKNTPLPLDIIFIGPDGRILNIEHGEPYRLQPVYSKGTTSGVLELNAGRSAELGIKPGDLVAW